MNDIERIFKSMDERDEPDSHKTKIIRGFKNWVADLKMEGKLVIAERHDMKNWIEKNHPQHAISHTALWEDYIS